MRGASPFDYWRAGAELMWLSMETQAVMSMRLLGMAGKWDVTDHEATRMIAEKPEAFGRAMMAGWIALATGQPATRVLTATTKPLRSRTRANTRRLARRGPKLK